MDLKITTPVSTLSSQISSSDTNFVCTINDVHASETPASAVSAMDSNIVMNSTLFYILYVVCNVSI